MKNACLAFAVSVVFFWSSLAAAGDFSQPYRFEVEAKASGYARNNYPAKMTVDFSSMLQSAGISGDLNSHSLRVVEVGPSGETLDSDVPFQFDPVDSAGGGDLVYFLSGETQANASRRFQVYFDTEGDYDTPAFDPRVKLVGSVDHERQLSYHIETYEDPQQSPSATWYYHQAGGGFASLEDKDGNDWLNYIPIGNGTFRGLPNLGHPGNIFHPGGTAVTSRIESEGPLRLTIVSESNDGEWATVWEMYPEFAQLTVLKAPRPYWFLYEGTPGGRLNEDTDFVVRSDGESILLGDNSWKAGDNDIAGPEWAYFADPLTGDDGRSFFAVHHEDDEFSDTYFPLPRNMTVFGFGRQNLDKFLTGVSHFTVGLVDDTAYESTKPIIEGAYLPMEFVLGSVEVVPEPGGLLLLAVGTVIAFGRRKSLGFRQE